MDDNEKISPSCMEELKIEEKKSRECKKKRCSALSEEEKKTQREGA